VFGFGRGTFAEYAVAREDKLARKPATASFEQAAVIPVSAVTALLALTDVGHVQPGQKVLITGASGGVGSYAVQLAAAFGAEVTAVCSTAKTDLVRSLGAVHVIDYTQDDFADGARRYDLIIDIAGNPPSPGCAARSPPPEPRSSSAASKPGKRAGRSPSPSERHRRRVQEVSSPCLMAVHRAVHWRGVTSSAGPDGFLESRTATVPGRLRATSTQFPPLLLL
jgi:threonine dehydrogenase-like Zn-dependent dehydrogenase